MFSNYAYKQSLVRASVSLFDALGRLWPRRSVAFPKESRPRVLVLRIDHLGDILCTLPFLKKLKQIAPHIHLTFLTTPAGRILLRDVPQIDDWFTFDPPWFARDSTHQEWPLKTMRDISAILDRRAFDLSIDLRGDIRHHLLTLWARIPYRAGYGQTGGGFLLQQTLPWNAQDHAIDKNMRFLELFDQNLALTHEERIPHLSWKARSDEEAWFGAVIGRQPYRVYHVDAGAASKRWPIDSFARLIAQMPTSEGKVILVGQTSSLTQSFRSSVRDPRVIDLVGKTSLAQLVTLLQRARAVLSGDSGPAHIAAALGTPTLVLWSGTNSPDIWKPRGNHVLILQNPVPCQYCEKTICPIAGHPCMNKLTVERVLPIWKGIGAAAVASA